MRRRYGRSLFLLALAGGVTAFSALWYVTASGEDSREPDFGGVYVEGLAGVPSRVNPLYAHQNAADETLAALVFAGLTRLDDRGEAFPDLAETWTVSRDGRTFTFRLRSGLLWHDGVALNASDVVFTYDLLRLPGLRPPTEIRAVLENAVVTAPDPRRVVFELARPFAPLPAYLTFGILPAHLLDGMDAAALLDTPFNRAPVGAGPYRLTQLRGDRAVLTANAAFHFGQPFIPRFELRFFANEGDLFGALRAGLLDGAYATLGLKPSDEVYVERHASMRVAHLSTGEVTSVYLNLELPVLQEGRVRQALFQAIDRDFIVVELFAGAAHWVESPLDPASWAFTTALSRYDFDAGVATSLLDEAGWRLGEDGVRRRAGDELAIRLSVGGDKLAIAGSGEGR